MTPLQAVITYVKQQIQQLIIGLIGDDAAIWMADTGLDLARSWTK
jgi:hypothetical protein